MATIKSYTDISQSKRLAKILPIESADMCWQKIYDENHLLSDYRIELLPFRLYSGLGVPAWSLSALLNVLAKIANKIDEDGSVNLSSFMGQWSVNMFDCPVEATDNYDNSIDACVKMIEKLHELNLL